MDMTWPCPGQHCHTLIKLSWSFVEGGRLLRQLTHAISVEGSEEDSGNEPCMKSNQGGPMSGEKTDVDEVLNRMVIKDFQPFTIVEDKGFRKLVRALNPPYVLPTKQQ
ncbi:uncharacterized protein AB9X84_016295 isoform 1-T1 [Acanthopagrus schlegelii]